MATENQIPPSPIAPVQKSPVPVWEAALVMVVTVFVSLFVGAFLYLISVPVALVVGELMFLIVPLSYLLFKRVDVKSYVRADFKPKFLFIGIGLGIALLFLDVIVSGVFTSIFGTSQAVENANTLISDLSKSPTGLIAVAASLSLAGVCEEFAFRAFLQNTITRRYSFLPALFISAAAFGLAHFDPQFVYILSTLTIGLFLGYVYHHFDSYIVSATAHSTLNIIVLITLLATIK